MALSKNAKRNLQAALVLLAPVLILVLVPDRWTLPVGMAGVVIGFSGLFGVRAYLWRLERLVKLLTDYREGGLTDIPTYLLSASEQSLLGMKGMRDSATHIAVLRRRQRSLRSLGVFLGCIGISAFFVILVIFGED